MTVRIVIALALLTGITGSPSVTIRPDSTDTSPHPNSVPETGKDTEILGQVRKGLDPAALLCNRTFFCCFFICSVAISCIA